MDSEKGDSRALQGRHKTTQKPFTFSVLFWNEKGVCHLKVTSLHSWILAVLNT